jgi:hypothetical protein
MRMSNLPLICKWPFFKIETEGQTLNASLAYGGIACFVLYWVSVRVYRLSERGANARKESRSKNMELLKELRERDREGRKQRREKRRSRKLAEKPPRQEESDDDDEDSPGGRRSVGSGGEGR